MCRFASPGEPFKTSAQAFPSARHRETHNPEVTGQVHLPAEAYFDTDLRFTRLVGANFGMTSGYAADGCMDWALANVACPGFTDTPVTAHTDRGAESCQDAGNTRRSLHGKSLNRAEHRAPWRTFDAVGYAILEWVARFNHPRPLKPVGSILPASLEQARNRHPEEPAMAA